MYDPIRDDPDVKLDRWEHQQAKKAGLSVDEWRKERWEREEAYLADAHRLVVNGNLCLTCHKVGGVEPKEYKGPTLDTFSDRGRPDWTQRWVTNPKRFLHYESIMPINFKASARENQDAFIGNSEDQIRAVTDFLMLHQQIKDWPILKGREPLGFGPAPATPMPAAGDKQ